MRKVARPAGSGRGSLSYASRVMTLVTPGVPSRDSAGMRPARNRRQTDQSRRNCARAKESKNSAVSYRGPNMYAHGEIGARQCPPTATCCLVTNCLRPIDYPGSGQWDDTKDSRRAVVDAYRDPGRVHLGCDSLRRSELDQASAAQYQSGRFPERPSGRARCGLGLTK